MDKPHICDVLCPGCGEFTYCVSCDLCEECDYESQTMVSPEEEFKIIKNELMKNFNIPEPELDQPLTEEKLELLLREQDAFLSKTRFGQNLTTEEQYRLKIIDETLARQPKFSESYVVRKIVVAAAKELKRRQDESSSN